MEDSCFECESTNNLEIHHVVPRSEGGNKTVYLCPNCHMKVHDIKGERRDKLNMLVKKGIVRAREKGIRLGRPKGNKQSTEDFLSKYSRVVELLKQKYSIRKTAKIANCGISTVQRIKKHLKFN